MTQSPEAARIPPRSPEAARVAAKIRAVMKAQSLSGTELAARIEQLTGTRPSDMWITRHRLGQVHLTRPVPVKVVHEALPDLDLIARALDVPAEELASAADEDSTEPADA